MNSPRLLAFICVTLAVLAAAPASQGAERIYYSEVNIDDSSVWYIEPSVGTPVLVKQVTSGQVGSMLTYNNTLYWTMGETGALWSSGLEGQNAHVLIQQNRDAYLRGIQVYDSQLYWANSSLGPPGVYRANWDGSGIQQVMGGYTGYQAAPENFGIFNGTVYWSCWDSPYILYYNLNVTGTGRITTGLGRAFAMDLDANSGNLYVGGLKTSGEDDIVRINLATGVRETLLAETLGEILSLDLFGDRLYYNTEQTASTDGRIWSIPLSGGTPRLEATVDSWQIYVEPEPATLFLLALGGTLALRRRKSIPKTSVPPRLP